MFEQRVRTTAVRERIGARVRVAGWLMTIRSLSKVGFLVLRDGWGTLQVVVTPAQLERLQQQRAGPGSVLVVEGVARDGPNETVELGEATVEVLEAIAEPLPVPLGRGLANAKLPTQLDHAPTVLRDPKRRAVLRVAAASVEGFRRTLGAEGFTEIHTPRLVATATESGANVFEVKYFEQTAYLAQSPQLYKQIMVGVFERVFEVGPVFRAEPHATVRHLAEYLSLDVEMGFIASHLEVAAMLGHVLRGMVEHLGHACATELEQLGVVMPAIPPTLPRVEFVQARAMIAGAGIGPEHAPDLAPAEEKWLGQWAHREHGSDVLLVTGYPMSKRPFYTHPAAEPAGASASFDLLLRGTELVTGGQRLHRYADVLAAIDAMGTPRETLAGYLEAFRYGMPPHGGFAIGLERFVAQLVGLDNIRQARAFPRDTTRLHP